MKKSEIKKHWFEKFYDYVSKQLFGGKKTIFTIFLLASFSAYSQSKLHVLAGYKSIELGYSFENEEFLNFGVSFSAADSKMLEKRANKNDVNRHIHKFKSDVVPAVFGTVGATFDSFIISGKVGGSYVSQDINKQATKDIFFAVGLSMEYQVSDVVGFKASYDNVNSVMAGITFKL